MSNISDVGLFRADGSPDPSLGSAGTANNQIFCCTQLEVSDYTVDDATVNFLGQSSTQRPQPRYDESSTNSATQQWPSYEQEVPNASREPTHQIDDNGMLNMTLAAAPVPNGRKSVTVSKVVKSSLMPPISDMNPLYDLSLGAAGTDHQLTCHPQLEVNDYNVDENPTHNFLDSDPPSTQLPETRSDESLTNSATQQWLSHEQEVPNATGEPTHQIDDNGTLDITLAAAAPGPNGRKSVTVSKEVSNAAGESSHQIDCNGMVYPEEISAPPPARAKRRKVSGVWLHYGKYKRPDGTEWAKCKHCSAEYPSSSKNGTSNLRKHLDKCFENWKNGDGEKTSEMSGVTAPAFKREKSMFEKVISENYGNNLPAALELQSHGSLKAKLLRFYQIKKESLRRSFGEHPSGWFHLTINLWRRGDVAMYCCLTSHFIDADWKLKKKVFAFKRVGLCNNYWKLFDFKRVLFDWGIVENVLFIAAQDAESNEIVTEMKDWLAHKQSLCSRFQPVGDITCILSLLNHLLEEGLQEARHLLCKIMNCISYVQEKPERNHKFREAVNQVRSQGKKVTSEDTRVSWTFTFQMLEGMLALSEAFNLLEIIDEDFSSLNPNKEEWERITLVYEFLKELDEGVRSFPGSTCFTTNEYFPKVCSIYWKLCQRTESANLKVRSMACKIKERFDRYWEKHDWVLAVAVVLDPRFKFDIVERWYKAIYGDDSERHCRRIQGILIQIYKEHMSSGSSYVSDEHQMLDSLGMPFSNDVDDVNSWKTEFNRYLEEPKYPRVKKFDILRWWRDNTQKFPTFAMMARRYLAIPMSAPISYPTGLADELNIDPASSDLEAVICAEDWMPMDEGARGRSIGRIVASLEHVISAVN